MILDRQFLSTSELKATSQSMNAKSEIKAAIIQAVNDGRFIPTPGGKMIQSMTEEKPQGGRFFLSPELKATIQNIEDEITTSLIPILLKDKWQYENQAEIKALLEEHLESQNEQTKILKEQSKEIKAARPDYVNRLIEAGLVSPDGITVWGGGLDKVADYLLNQWKMDFLSPELLLQFRQKNGKEFSLSTAREAVKRAKPSKNKKRNRLDIV